MLDTTVQKELINRGREFMKGYRDGDAVLEAFESDQELRLPQPPLVRAPVTPEENWIRLPVDFNSLNLNNDLVALLQDRHSSRVYTRQTITLTQLSFLLWATQGVKKMRGKSYATLRTVPSGGARHEYETFLVVQSVEGLAPGAYHYLPLAHALEFLHPVEDLQKTVSDTLCEQSWAGKASVVFYWSVVAYRAEWRYGITAHRPALIDAGHIGQNLYLACTGMGLGTCGIAAFSHEQCCALFGLDGEEEFVVYAAPVGTISEQNRAQEQAFYSFVQEENL